MKVEAIRFARYGGPEVLEHGLVELPEPSPGLVRVRHHAIGVNYIDTYHRSGLYPVPALPSGLGLEAAGVVEAVGPGVDIVSEGDRVAYYAGPPDSYAAARNVPANRLVFLPDSVSYETAAGGLLKGLTVEYLVRRTYRVRPGDTVLLHAAAGGVGSLATQWLAHLGATVIGTVGTAEKAERARSLGCQHPVLYSEEDFVVRVHEITNGAGVPVVYDSVGRATLLKSLDCLSPRGLCVLFGNASGAAEPLDLGLLGQKGSLFITRPTLFAYTATRSELMEAADAFFDVLVAGAVRVDVNHRWSLADAAEAHRAIEARQTTGSIVLIPGA